LQGEALFGFGLEQDGKPPPPATTMMGAVGAIPSLHDQQEEQRLLFSVALFEWLHLCIPGSIEKLRQCWQLAAMLGLAVHHSICCIKKLRRTWLGGVGGIFSTESLCRDWFSSTHTTLGTTYFVLTRTSHE
jgi:hypothetical protein